MKRALSNDGKRYFGSVQANLSQATSVPDLLRHTWKTVHGLKRNNRGVPALVELEEFDSHVGADINQYRHVLTPLWDGATQVEGEEEFRDGVSAVDLGPFVSVCVMSKVEDFATARRMLVALEKGLDFLTRVDVVVEIPPFDCTATQLEFSLVSAFDRARPAEANPGSLAAIGEVALWALTWQNPTDNFRTLSKALKTAQAGEALTFASLNLSSSTVQDFTRSLCEFADVRRAEVARLLDEEVERASFMIAVSKTGTQLRIKERPKIGFHAALTNPRKRAIVLA